jgi:fluoroacetyl-CoA thioesterase
MKPIAPGYVGHYAVVPEYLHSAEAVGNKGVVVVSTPHLIGFLEMAAHTALMAHFEAGESSVGTRVSIEHVAAAAIGRSVECEAVVKEVRGKRVAFDVIARQGGREIMRGTHERAVILLEPFLERLRAEVMQ